MQDSTRRKLTMGLLMATMVGGAAACGGGSTPSDSGSPGREVRSQKQRVTTPSVADADKQALVAGNNAFAADLYKSIADEHDNLFYSPYSISVALGMTYAGARGDTATEMAQVLHYDLAQDKLHPAFDWLDLHLMDLAKPTVNEESEPFEFSVVNSIWGQQDYHFEQPFWTRWRSTTGRGFARWTLRALRKPPARRSTTGSPARPTTASRTCCRRGRSPATPAWC